MLTTMSDFLTRFFPHKEMLSGFLLLTMGCTPQLFWAKSDAQPGEFDVDVRQCRERVTSDSEHQSITEALSLKFGVSENAIEQCLMAKGWFLAEKP
jgi:hypothetical protein